MDVSVNLNYQATFSAIEIGNEWPYCALPAKLITT